MSCWRSPCRQGSSALEPGPAPRIAQGHAWRSWWSSSWSSRCWASSWGSRAAGRPRGRPSGSRSRSAARSTSTRCDCPLHRVYQLKSGGASSLLREDAGGVGELIFSMLYNPWQAVVQFLGGVVVLAWVDWRLLLGALLLVPGVYYSDLLWNRRIRPLFRDVRKERQEIDSQTTEVFGGMRVVRAFGRQKSESARFMGENHFMARLELHVWWLSRLIELLWEFRPADGLGRASCSTAACRSSTAGSRSAT